MESKQIAKSRQAQRVDVGVDLPGPFFRIAASILCLWLRETRIVQFGFIKTSFKRTAPVPAEGRRAANWGEALFEL